MNVRTSSLYALLIALGCNATLSVREGGTAGDTGAGGKWLPGMAGEPQDASGAAGDQERGFGGTGGTPPGTSGWSFGGSGLSQVAGGPVGGGGAWSGAGSPAGGGSGGVDGEIGQNCVSGDLVTEAEGSPAKAVIRTLDRCNEGLSCNAQGKCVPAPDCPQSSGVCLLRRTALPENTGGAAGYPGTAGAAGAGSITIDKIGVVALGASESHVHWVEYGTRSALGNYQHDGTLMSYTIADGTTTTVASELEGPTGLGLTTTHAYIYVDGGRLIGQPTQPQLLRVPLAGGSPELVQDGTLPGEFVAVGSQAFWSKGTQIYSMTSDANAVPSVFPVDNPYWGGLTSDGLDLYYWTTNGVVRTPIADPVSTSIVGEAAHGLALHDDGIFTLESTNGGGLLSRAPKSGGAFLRVRALGAGAPDGLRVVGDRYFLDVLPAGVPGSNGQYTFKRQVVTADFVGSDPPIRLLERRDRRTIIDHLWVGTSAALYWSDGRAIYKQPLPTP